MAAGARAFWTSQKSRPRGDCRRLHERALRLRCLRDAGDKKLRPTLGEYRHRIPDVDAQTVRCGQDTFQTDLADSAVEVAIMMTNDRPSRIRLDHSTRHSMRARIRKLLRS